MRTKITRSAFTIGTILKVIFAKAAAPTPDAAYNLATQSVESITQEFVGSDTAQIMLHYAHFFPVAVLTRPGLAGEIADYVHALDIPAAAPQHRYHALPGIAAVHQAHHFIEDDKRHSLVGHVLAALHHEMPLVREMTLQNLITSMPNTAHIRDLAKHGSLLIQDPQILQTLEKFYPEAIVNPAYESALNSFTIFLLNAEKMLRQTGRLAQAARIDAILAPARGALPAAIRHIGQVIEHYDRETPLVNKDGSSNIFALSPQPTEALFGWENMAAGGMNRRYLFTLAIERARVLMKNFANLGDADEIKRNTAKKNVSVLAGLFREMKIWKGLMERPLLDGAADVYADSDKDFHYFLTAEMGQIIADTVKYPSEPCDANTVRIMKTAPLAQNSGTHFGSVSSKVARDYFLEAKLYMDNVKIGGDPAPLALVATKFMQAAGHNEVTVSPEDVRMVGAIVSTDSNTYLVSLDTRSPSPKAP